MDSHDKTPALVKHVIIHREADDDRGFTTSDTTSHEHAEIRFATREINDFVIKDDIETKRRTIPER